MKENYILFPTRSTSLRTMGNKKQQKYQVNQLLQSGYLAICLTFLFSLSTNAAVSEKTALFAFQDCTEAPIIVGASNVSDDSAIINWVAVSSAASPTYTLEVYTDAAFTTLFESYTAINATNYSVTGLTNNTTYFYRVKVDNTTCGDYANGSFTAQLSYTPLAVSGFSQDVIANGTGPASASTTASVDNSLNAGANFAYLSINYKPTEGSPALTYGLPVNRSLSSPNISGLSYILEDYSVNNSLRLPNQNAFGVLELDEPVALSDIYLAVASGDGSSQISVEVEFTDGTTQDAVTGISVINWDSPATTASPALITNIGRVKRPTGVASSGNFKVFQLSIPVELENQTKLVSGVKVTKTDTGSESKIPNIFAVSGKMVSNCPSISLVSASVLSQTSAEFEWTIGSLGLGGGDMTYTLEVYTDEAYTIPVEGSPFTDIEETSYTLSGLTLDAEYFYRVKANNGTCDSEYVDADFILGYCEPARTGASTLYHITNVSTTTGYTNINNSTDGASPYTNYSETQIVSKPAGTTFSYSVTRSSIFSSMAVWVDWNGDLDFDDEGEAIAQYGGGFGQQATVTGTITIPADAALGNYRMRVRSTYYLNTPLSPCGGLQYSDTEDYTVTVAEQPEDCVVPETPELALSDITASEITGTVTPADDAPTGYVLIRSTLDALTEEPQSGATYTVGTVFGGGTVIASGASIDSFTHFLAANTHYYYYLYAYNEGGLSCFGPIYSEAATADAVTCAIATTVATASDITNTSATLNWSSVVGAGGSEATYTIEVYSDEALTDLIDTYTSTTNSYSLGGLTNGDMYYYRVKAETTGCDNDAWSLTSSFTAQSGYTPLTVTGFNADVIANGTGIANLSTTNAVDAVDNSYIALNYERVSGNVTTIGLPLSRTLTSAAITDLKFLMADYSGNNSLRLAAQDQSGSLTLAQPLKLSDVYLAVTSGSGPSTISVEIQFADGTSQVAAGISVSDWYGAASANQPALIGNIGRANRANNVGNVETGNSKVFYVTIPVDVDNQSKLVTSVDITKTSGGLQEPVPNIFAVSGNVIDCPSLSELVVTAGIEDAEFTFGVAGTEEETSYNIEVYTDAELTMPVEGSPFTTTDADYTVTGLDALTTYYFNVEAVTDVCVSSEEGMFTTGCLAPDAPVAMAQAVCNNSTIDALEAEVVDGAVLNWFATEDGEALEAGTIVVEGTYYVSQTLEGCESDKTTVEVTINTVPELVVEAQTVCAGTTVSEIPVEAAIGMVYWYATEDGEVLIDGTVLETGTYYVSQMVDGCESEKYEVSVTVNVTAEPTAEGQQVFCSGSTVSELFAAADENGELNWYASEDAVDTLDPEAEIIEGSYFVSQTIDGCESARIEVMATVNPTPDAPDAEGMQDYSAGQTLADLTVTLAEGGTANWYTMNGEGQYIAVNADTVLEDDMTYYVTQSVLGCESGYTAIVVNEVLGTSTFDLSALSVYPNPATDVITVTNRDNISQITLVNLLGQTVMQQTANATEVQLNIATLAQGTYILQVQSGSKVASIKVIKK